MDMTNQDYGKLVNQYSQSSPLGKNMVWAFLVGGAICTAGQGLSNLYQNWGMDQDAAGGAVSITLILAAALLTGLGWFDKLAKRAEPWCPSPVLPTPWSPPLWSSKARG